jgi:hypothetical protein
MSRRPAATAVIAAALSAAVAAPLTARADELQVNAALLFLQASCGLKDARLESRRSEGRLLLTLRTPQFTRQTNLVHGDLRMFAEASLKKNAELPPEIGGCFYPATNQVIDVLMGLPPDVASLPLAPPPAPAAAQGAYVPPMMSAPPPPAPAVAQATVPAPAAVAPAAPTVGAPGGPSYAIQGCRVSDDSDAHVVCEVRVANATGRDLTIAINRARTRLLDANGNEEQMNTMKLSQQNVEWRDNTGRVKVINDTSPLVQVVFYHVPKSWKLVKRMDLSIGYDTMDGTNVQVVSAADMPIRGR